jgi:membrane associated rhomboid family serine protease
MAATAASQRKSRIALEAPLTLVIIIWAVFGLSVLFPSLQLNRYGISARDFSGLVGVLFAPLLHANLFHIAMNTVPLFVLMILLILQAGKRWALRLVSLWLLTGIATWFIGRSGSVHVGASGVLYALLTYLMAAGIFQRDWRSMLISAFVFLGYGSLLWRVFPTYWYISWESHLSGAVIGVLVASMTRKR